MRKRVQRLIKFCLDSSKVTRKVDGERDALELESEKDTAPRKHGHQWA